MKPFMFHGRRTESQSKLHHLSSCRKIPSARIHSLPGSLFVQLRRLIPDSLLVLHGIFTGGNLCLFVCLFLLLLFATKRSDCVFTDLHLVITSIHLIWRLTRYSVLLLNLFLLMFLMLKGRRRAFRSLFKDLLSLQI